MKCRSNAGKAANAEMRAADTKRRSAKCAAEALVCRTAWNVGFCQKAAEDGSFKLDSSDSEHPHVVRFVRVGFRPVTVFPEREESRFEILMTPCSEGGWILKSCPAVIESGLKLVELARGGSIVGVAVAGAAPSPIPGRPKQSRLSVRGVRRVEISVEREAPAGSSRRRR